MGEIWEDYFRVGVDISASGTLRRMLVQTLLFYDYKTWVSTEPMLSSLEGAHVGFSQVIVGVKPQRCGRGG